MKLRAKVLCTILATWCFIIGGTYLGAVYLLQQSYADLEQKQIYSNLNILKETLQALSESNLATITSWTNWDTLYNHMRQADRQTITTKNLFFSDIINPGALLSANADIYLIFTPQGKLYFSAALNADKSSLIEAPNEVLQLFTSSSALNKFVAPVGKQSNVSGLISTPKGILILGSHQILPSVGEGIPQGTGVLLSYLTHTVWDKIKKDSNLNLDFYNISQQDEHIKKIYPHLLKNELYKVNLNDNILFLYTFLRDINNKPIGIIKVTAPRSIHLLGQNTIFYFNLTFLVLGIIFSLLLFYLLRFLIIDRLTTINKKIQTITETKNFNLQVTTKGSDEISSIGNAINKMLKIIADIEVTLTNTINFMPSVMLIVDNNLNIININQFAEKELGFIKDVKGKYLFNLFPYLEAYKNQFNHPDQLIEIEQINYKSDNGMKYYKALIYPLRQSEDKNLVIRLDDITERINTNKILLQQDRLSVIGSLTAGVLHEINNPVNFIVSAVNPLKNDILQLYNLWNNYTKIQNLSQENILKKIKEIEELKESFDFDYTLDETESLAKGMHEGITRIEKILSDLQSFFKNDKEAMIQADIHQGIEATLSLLKPNFDKRIEIEKKYGNLSIIKCHYGKLNQVFMNIISNAIEAIPDKGKITISTEKINNSIKITIDDTGIGITDENIHKIFNPFYTTKPVGKSIGLGLSIVSSIIRDHQGTIEVSSKPGIGSKFIITLPIG